MEIAHRNDPTAYDNADFIPDGAAYWGRWEAAAAAFRAVAGSQTLSIPYGPHPREAYDLFRPTGTSRGLVVFLHGGFWRMGERALWSHLAAGPTGAGWAVALPSYPLCPEMRVSDITVSIARALPAMANAVAGPIVVAGHSAGGHLTLRMLGEDVGLPDEVAQRIVRVCAISPLSDLAPLTYMPMNKDLRLDLSEARSESPVHQAVPSQCVDILVGALERPAFIDQALWMADAWPHARLSIVADRHHFDIIEPLQDSASPLVQSLTSDVV